MDYGLTLLLKQSEMRRKMSHPETPTSIWLTAILRQTGVLLQGEVTAVEERQSDAFNSQLAFLHLSYSADVQPNLPTQFVLKISS